MADAAPPETPLPPQSLREGHGTAAGQAHRRLRWVTYLAFAVLALAVLAQGHYLFRLQALRAADTAIVDRAAERRAEDRQRALWLGTSAVLVVLLMLGVTAVEASARRVRRTTARLQERAAELQRLALVAQRTAALVLITDRDDRLTWVNDAFTRVTGWPLADAAGQRPGELLDSPHADAKVLARVQGAIRQGRGARHEWLHRSRGGRDLWLDVDLCPLRDDDGQPSGFVRVCTDVTMRVQQQDKLQALWKAMPVGVVVQGAGGEIVEANRAAERLLGLSHGATASGAVRPNRAGGSCARTAATHRSKSTRRCAR